MGVTLDPMYGQNSGGTYTTHYELRHAFENKMKIVPLIMYEGAWPPAQLRDALLAADDEVGASYVNVALTPSLVALSAKPQDWPVIEDGEKDAFAEKLAATIVEGVEGVGGRAQVQNASRSATAPACSHGSSSSAEASQTCKNELRAAIQRGHVL